MGMMGKDGKRKHVNVPVWQEHGLDCGIACVAFLTGETYKKIFKQWRKRASRWRILCIPMVSQI
jgi:hypothetical protein